MSSASFQSFHQALRVCRRAIDTDASWRPTAKCHAHSFFDERQDVETEDAKRFILSEVDASPVWKITSAFLSPSLPSVPSDERATRAFMQKRIPCEDRRRRHPLIPFLSSSFLPSQANPSLSLSLSQTQAASPEGRRITIRLRLPPPPSVHCCWSTP